MSLVLRGVGAVEVGVDTQDLVLHLELAVAPLDHRNVVLLVIRINPHVAVVLASRTPLVVGLTRAKVLPTPNALLLGHPSLARRATAEVGSGRGKRRVTVRAVLAHLGLLFKRQWMFCDNKLYQNITQFYIF